MAINNFKPFATAANANVMSQADWEALPALLSGFISGPAKSAQVNKAIRQASFIAAALAQYTANKSGLDVLDDGDVAGFIAKMSTAFGKDFQALDATLTALAGLATGANKLPYFTGADTVAQTDLTQIGRDVIGQTTVANLLSYLGLGDGSALPVGVPVPWPTATAPTGWLKCNGAAFTAAQYPKLAVAYPSLVLPDLRGEFIRGLDDSRGVDSGRVLLSSQGDAIRNITGQFGFVSNGFATVATGVFSLLALATTGQTVQTQSNSYAKVSMDASAQVPTATENRPRNIAFNYIVRAA